MVGRLIISRTSDVAIYLTTCFVIVLLVMHMTRFKSNVRTYISGKVRLLIEEAPVLSYVYQLALCIICLLFQYYFFGFTFVFWNLLVVIIIITFIIVYVFIHRNRYVLAKLKTTVFINICAKKEGIA